MTIDTLKSGLSEGWTEEEVLRFLQSRLGKDPTMDVALVERLGDFADVRVGEALQKIWVFAKDRATRKEIKRSLFRIKSRGIPLAEVMPEGNRPVLSTAGEEPPKGLAGSIDGLGHRVLVLAIPHQFLGNTFMMAVVNDTQGWVNFGGGKVSKKRYNHLLRECQGEKSLLLVETEPAYVFHLVEEAHELSVRNRRLIPQDYLNLRPTLERLRKRFEKPLVYSLLEPERGLEGEVLLERSGDLLMTDLFYDWVLDGEELKPYIQAVLQARGSRLVLTEEQREARIEEIYRKALLELFSEERRLLYKRRLEEMAYILLKRNRDEEARMALAAAVDLEGPLHLLKPNPFLYRLVVRSISLGTEKWEEKEKEDSSLIVRI